MNRGLNLLESKHKSIVRHKLLEGRTIVNHIPLFDSDRWTFSNTTPSTIEPNVLVYSNQAGNNVYAVAHTTLKPNTKYTLSAKHDGYMAIENVSLEGVTTKVVLDTKEQQFTFTVPSNTKYVRVYLSSNSEVGTFTFRNPMLNEGVDVQPFVSNVKGVTNPTITKINGNLISNDIREWTYGLTLTDDGYFSKTDNTGYEGFHEVTLTPGRYYFSVKGYTDKSDTNEAKVSYQGFDEFGNTALSGSFSFRDYTTPTILKTFIEIPEGFTIRFRVYSIAVSKTIYFKDVMLYPSDVEIPYSERKIESMTLKSTFYDGENPYVDGNVVKVKRKFQEIELGSEQDWEYVSASTGYKTVKTPNKFGATFYSPSYPEKPTYLIKYNGLLIKNDFISSNPTGEVFNIHSDGNLYIMIPNSDSGWGDSYTPTPGEIKAYFLGWKMYEMTNGYSGSGDVYNGTGTKGWGILDDSRNGDYLADGTAVLPTVQAPITRKWQTYRLIYELDLPYTEIVETIGNVTLDKGPNVLELTSGRVIREVAHPFDVITGHGVINSIFTSGTTDEGSSKLKYKVRKILSVYKNSVPFNEGYVRSDQYSYGEQRYYIFYPHFDPNALYEVDYEPLYPFEITVPIENIIIEHASNISNIVEELVESVSSQYNNIGQINSLVLPILSNGIIIESGQNSNGTYVKFADGTLLCRMLKAVDADANVRGNTNITFPVKMSDGWTWVASVDVCNTTATLDYNINHLSHSHNGWDTSLQVNYNFTYAQTYTISAIVFGRWK